MRLKNSILLNFDKEAEINRIRDKMYMADAVRVGKLGSIKHKKFDGGKWFSRWWNRQRRSIKKLSGQKAPTIWEYLKPGKSRKI